MGTKADKSEPYPPIWDQLSLYLILCFTTRSDKPKTDPESALWHFWNWTVWLSVTRLFQNLYPYFMRVVFVLTCAPRVPCPKSSQIELQNNPICRISFPLPLLSSCTQTKLYSEDSLQDRQITKKGKFFGAKLSMTPNPVRPSSA